MAWLAALAPLPRIAWLAPLAPRIPNRHLPNSAAHSAMADRNVVNRAMVKAVPVDINLAIAQADQDADPAISIPKTGQGVDLVMPQAGQEVDLVMLQSGHPVDPVLAGEVLFKHVWTRGDPLTAGGDGLGPVFNARSCVACHQYGGVGGSGGKKHNVQLFTLSNRSRAGASARAGGRTDLDIPQGPELQEGVIHKAATDPAFLETVSFVERNWGHATSSCRNEILPLSLGPG
jgi:hypothetical protein